MTRLDDGPTYFLYLAKEGETEMPATISIKSHRPENGITVTLLWHRELLKWVPKGKASWQTFQVTSGKIRLATIFGLSSYQDWSNFLKWVNANLPYFIF